ncbi:hypothetical protein [Listeria booriae]|nr:hypothetical protein [Listeria booriae]
MINEIFLEWDCCVQNDADEYEMSLFGVFALTAYFLGLPILE